MSDSSWKLVVSRGAVKQLARLDRPVAAMITNWLAKNVDGTTDPRLHGKPLSSDLSGAWRYRIGNYRVICHLDDGQLVVLAIEVAHRREVYQRARRH